MQWSKARETTARLGRWAASASADNPARAYVSLRPRLEVRLKHRFEDELERTLHRSVPNRRDRQDADFAPVFRYLLLRGWEWLVGGPGPFGVQLVAQRLHTLGTHC